MSTSKPGVDANGYQHRGLATNTQVYHPRKGWRNMRAYPSTGYYKIQVLLQRAF